MFCSKVISPSCIISELLLHNSFLKIKILSQFTCTFYTGRLTMTEFRYMGCKKN